MEWVKTTAKTLPEAIDLALDNLGVDESEAEIVVLEEPTKGLFGRMRGTARVEARVKPKAIRPKNERNRNRRSRSEGGKGKSNDRNRNRNRNRSGSSGSGSGGGGGGGKKNSGKNSSGRQRNDERSRSSAKSGGDGGGRGGRGQSGDRGRSGQDGRRRSEGRSNNNDHETKPKEETPVDEVAAHLQSFLTGLTEAFGLDGDVTIDTSEEDVLVGRIEGQHGLLVGPKGRTLDAVQELARISCQRTVPSSIRIKVDVGGYRQQRVEALAAFARKAADSAVEGSTEVALEPMSAADRKAVHDALSEDDRVETRSVGTDPRRKVLVEPVETDDDDQVDDPGDDAVDEEPVDQVDADAEADDDVEADDVEADAGADADAADAEADADAELVDADVED